jgi:phosphatidylinositol alpha-1,6-mannosyltransferase
MSTGWSRVVILTPRWSGADGVSAVTRLYTHALAAQLGTAIDDVQVWSLGDDVGTGIDDRRVRFYGAGGNRLRFGALCLRGPRVGRETLVVVQHVHLLPVALPLVWRGARLFLLLHGVEAWKPLRALERAGCRAAWKIAAVSAHTARRFREMNPQFADRLVDVCPPGFPNPRPLAMNRHSAPYALIVGRMSSEERYKGHDLLIDIWPKVCRSVPQAQLVIVGGGDDRARLEAKAAHLGLASAVRFEGIVSDERLTTLYRDATLFVMPSPNEGFGLVYIEAMSAGVPCVVARGAAEEIVDNGTTGMVVPPDDAAAVERAIVRLLTSRDERDRMGAAAAEDVRRRFSATAFAARLYDLLHLPRVAAAC